MAKKQKYGLNTYHKRTRKKRPGRHSKRPNKKNRRKPSIGQGKK